MLSNSVYACWCLVRFSDEDWEGNVGNPTTQLHGFIVFYNILWSREHVTSAMVWSHLVLPIWHSMLCQLSCTLLFLMLPQRLRNDCNGRRQHMFRTLLMPTHAIAYHSTNFTINAREHHQGISWCNVTKQSQCTLCLVGETNKANMSAQRIRAAYETYSRTQMMIAICICTHNAMLSHVIGDLCAGWRSDCVVVVGHYKQAP